MTSQIQVKAQIWAALLLLILGLWILQGFLVPIVWAVVLGLATWPLYELIRRGLFQSSQGAALPALIITLGIAAILFGPVTYGLIQVGHELQSIAHLLQHAHRNGLPAPDWLLDLPLIGDFASKTWSQWLGSSDSVQNLLKHMLSSNLPMYTQKFASQILHRYVSAFFTLVVLFFIYKNGSELSLRFLALCDKVFGDNGSRYVLHAGTAVKATVNGIVLVAMGQGILMGFGYAFAGFQHATLMGIVTGFIALIPFAAKIVVLGSVIELLAEGKMGAGLGLLAFGLVVILLADNYIKPKLIGGAVKLPFIWTLFGILGGIESFGMLGLFLGPTIMAILMSVWRDAIADSNEVPTLHDPTPEGG